LSSIEYIAVKYGGIVENSTFNATDSSSLSFVFGSSSARSSLASSMDVSDEKIEAGKMEEGWMAVVTDFPSAVVGKVIRAHTVLGQR
jgi:hypothetical protein